MPQQLEDDRERHPKWTADLHVCTHRRAPPHMCTYVYIQTDRQLVHREILEEY